MVEQMVQYFKSGATLSYDSRKQNLLKLKEAIEQNEQKILNALHSDLKKSAEEAFSTEVGFVYSEISHCLNNLKKWMKPQSVSTPLILQPSSSKIYRDPLGIVLIIAPWNYPFQLLMAPLVGAFAGGNCAVLKPSELAPNTATVVEEMIREAFTPQLVSVVNGDGAEVVPALMKDYRFDHVFFTGSIPIGREIATLAASKLVPVTLELGGKSPCVVDEEVDIAVAARRITWGKFTNAGQTCVAPDYLLVHESRRDALLEGIEKNIKHFYGADPINSYDYGRIINQKHFDRLSAYLDEGRVQHGGATNKNELYIEPTLLTDVPETGTLMQNEIFGPLLPIYTFREHHQALEFVSRHPNPLSFYLFTKNKQTIDLYNRQVAFGGGCINNTLVHLANLNLPFGGVGNSGIGAYHGKFSFDTFTRPKPLLKSSTLIDPGVKYPPYEGKLSILKKFFR